MKKRIAHGLFKPAVLTLSIGTAAFLIVQAQRQADPAPAADPVEHDQGTPAPGANPPVNDFSDRALLGTSKSAATPAFQWSFEDGADPLLGERPEAPIPMPTTLGTSKSLSPMELEKLMGKKAEAPSKTSNKNL